MAAKQYETNLKLIKSVLTTPPTTQQLPLGYMAFGLVNGKPSIWGNYDGSVHDLIQEGSPKVNIVQDIGTSTTSVMSQNAIREISMTHEANITQLESLVALLEQNMYGNEGIVGTLDSRVVSVEEKVPNQASKNNQLADKAFVNSSIQNMAAQYVTPTEDGERVWMSLEMLRTGPYYHAGQEYTPTKNDYAIFINSDDSTWRAHFDGTQWDAQYQVNDTPLTAAQVAALNSGWTATLTNSTTSHLTNTQNPHSTTKVQVGLGNVDNTADSDKPVSTAQRAALDSKANLESPVLTGTPTVPTAPIGDSSTVIANTDFVKTAIDRIPIATATVAGKVKVPAMSGLAVNEETGDISVKLGSGLSFSKHDASLGVICLNAGTGLRITRDNVVEANIAITYGEI